MKHVLKSVRFTSSLWSTINANGIWKVTRNIVSGSPSLIVCSVIYIEPSTTVLGGSEVFVGMGSTINLTCVIRLSPEPPNSIRWQHNNQVCIIRTYFIRFLVDKLIFKEKKSRFNADASWNCIFLKLEHNKQKLYRELNEYWNWSGFHQVWWSIDSGHCFKYWWSFHSWWRMQRKWVKRSSYLSYKLPTWSRTNTLLPLESFKVAPMTIGVQA